MGLDGVFAEGFGEDRTVLFVGGADALGAVTAADSGDLFEVC